MNTFKRKALFTAVLAGLGAAFTAEAVYLNPNVSGQVLVYPYYTVAGASQDPWSSYLAVVNQTSRAKAAKVRVIEDKTTPGWMSPSFVHQPADVDVIIGRAGLERSREGYVEIIDLHLEPSAAAVPSGIAQHVSDPVNSSKVDTGYGYLYL